jgi:pimeloyl-ACP methyl ester carboxylesterase
MLSAEGIEYEEQGRGDPVLLIHGGFISDALSLVARESALCERYRTIWYRRRGYGGSKAASEPFSIAAQARDAQTLLDHLDLDRAHVVGHSGGGVVATEFAMLAPARVRSLVVLEPAIFPPPLAEAFPDMVAPAMEAYRAGDLSSAVDAFMNMVAPAPDWRGELEAVLPGAPERADRDAPFTFGSELFEFNNWPFHAERARALSMPVLYGYGTKSGALFEMLRDHFRSVVPNAEVVELPDTDHSMNTTHPALVATAVADFIAAH